MRVLLANYRYFVYGGPERYLFGVERALRDRGHDVVPFSIGYEGTEPTDYARYFVPPPAGGSAIRFEQQPWRPRAVWKTLERSFYSREVEKAVERLVEDHPPDVAYILHFLKKLSPSLLVGLARKGIPIVVRLSDLLLICPEAHLTREGKICTLCTDGPLWPSVRHRCVRNSIGASLVHLAATRFHRWKRYFDLVEKFVVPSECTREWMVRAGWPEEKFEVVPTFVDPFFFASSQDTQAPQRDYFLYVGLLEEHKGVEVLLRAYAQETQRGSLPTLKIAGSTATSFGARCVALAKELNILGPVEFLDFVSRDRLPELYRNAAATVVPSLCYENMPNVLGESYAAGTPVIGSNHGSIAPLVSHGETGLLFGPGDVDDLATQLRLVAGDSAWSERAGRTARDFARQELDLDGHLTRLETIFANARKSACRADS